MIVGNQKLKVNNNPVNGEYVKINNEIFYKISNYDMMNPFLISIVSNSDHWMFISSNGGLTAGRKNPDNALFPYYTDDIIHTSHETTGNKTILRVTIGQETFLWEPFTDCHKNLYSIKRNLYKNIPGNKIVFEEVNEDLGLVFSYSWLNSEKFGFIKNSKIKNINDESVSIECIDGFQNILPYGLYQQFQTELSTLADGYKRSELLEEDGIGIYTLSSIPSDKAEPSESLKATTVWSTGVDVDNYLLSSKQLNNFRIGEAIVQELDEKGVRGAYFINVNFNLTPEEENNWFIVAEINQDHSKIVRLQNLIKSKSTIESTLFNDIDEGTASLVKLVASADGLQLSGDTLATSRHFSNVLFNLMRGGIFDDSYWVDKDDFISFLKVSNKIIYEKHKPFLESLDAKLDYEILKNTIEEKGDSQLTKLAIEYLPLTFSRRHGDPSRPWNRFSIDIKDKYGNKVLNYQGNWRDLFQNWEALALSFPKYLESMIAKFVNASTADGYNPYRVTRSGFDWEAPEEDTPWANIGYWGDHQIIYLLKLLELSYKFNSNDLKKRLTDEIYSYANVPYRINRYEDILKDPQNTIEFDHILHNRILEKEKEIGSDARFLYSSDGNLYQVNLTEKLLVTLLSKLSNFIPGGGIWMNTQRPEWNDANNALVGNGVSMVTLYYIRRYLTFCIELFESIEEELFKVSNEVLEFYNNIKSVFEDNKTILTGEISDKNRKEILDSLGEAGELFRSKIYENGFTGQKDKVSRDDLKRFFSDVRECIDNTISINKREDNLYHAYNLMSLDGDKLSILHLYEMLEGQVAVISSGYLDENEVIKILDALYKSKLYRKDQNSFILYPNRELPHFIEKNNIPKEKFLSSKALMKLIELDNKDIVTKDDNGNFHFNGEIRNASELNNRLEAIATSDLDLENNEKDRILEIYESTFNHKAFTGRSGTFYKYEGLGCIYWHMVSKLVLAVEEIYLSASNNSIDNELLKNLKTYYYQLKDGIGLYKSPELYGAFPTDPYSHTPSFAGVQQPGMTGQVKEDIISRFGEFGISVKDGQILIDPSLINQKEFNSETAEFDYYTVDGVKRKITIPKDSFVFTFCQIPFVYIQSNHEGIEIKRENGNSQMSNSMMIDNTLSESIFGRKGEIVEINVFVDTKKII